MTSSLDSRDVTVVIQGPVLDGASNIADAAIRAVRTCLPDAEIILSIQGDQPAFSCEGVTVVRSEPCAHFSDINGNTNNVNKLIASMQCGLQAASREYCLKLRTDHLLVDASIIACLRAVAEAPALLFSRRIGVSNLFLRDPCKLPYLFHLTDTLQFGRTDDLRKLWDIGRLPGDYVYSPRGPRTNPLGTFQGYTAFRLLPEQAIFLRFAQKHGLALDLAHISHTSFKLMVAWEDLLVDNFEVFDWQGLGVTPPARFLSGPYVPASIMAPRDLHRLRACRSLRHRRQRYMRLLLNKYVLCWFSRRWLVSASSLLLFSFCPQAAVYVRRFYRGLTGAQRP